MANLDTVQGETARRRRSPQGDGGSTVDQVSPDLGASTEVADTGTAQLTIAGKSFTVPNRYSEGHVLTRGEAAQLNQVFHENIRNNMAKKVKDSEAPDEELQRMVDEYAQSYQPGVRQGGGRTADPVLREAKRLARARIEEILKGRGENPKDYTADAMAEAVEKNVAKFMDQARQNIEGSKGIQIDLA